MIQTTAARRMKEAEWVMKTYSSRWMKLDGVVACAIGLANEKDPTSVVIKIYVRRLDLPSVRKIPKKVEGVPIVLQRSGPIKALPKN